MKNQFLCILSVCGLLLASCSKTGIDQLDGKISNDLENQAVASVPQGHNWMSFKDNNVSLSSLSIPGTHDSGARHEPVAGTAKTQNLSISEQLQIGVRFLDIRCRFVDNNFAIHHGAIYQHLNFDDVLGACKTFLQNNPSETIIMSVKEEHTPSGNSMSFEQRFVNYTTSYPGLFHLGNSVPNLGDVRGKVVLVRRFGTTANIGINASSGWADKATFQITTSSGAKLHVQDEYQVSNNTNKWNAISSLLNTSKSNTGDRPLYLNFSSGYQQILGFIPNITSVSNAMNPNLIQYMQSNPTGMYGVIITDFVYQGLSSAIFEKNF